MLQNQRIEKVALYARRSPEDKGNRQNLFRGDGVSDSIESQLLMLQQQARCMGFLDCKEYYDDNISGTTFARPSFMEMLDDIQVGKVNTVMIKDLSRLGRDYIESGRYQEIVFPELGTRLIALDDGYDSATGAGTDMAAFKNVYNDLYVRDVSKKTRSALKARATAGKYLSSGIYGYQKDPNDKNHLVPDPETAPVVQRIFAMTIGGHSFRSIARALSEEGILTPSAYKGIAPRLASCRPTDWNPISIGDMVRDEQYLGKTIYGQRRKVSYKSKKLVENPEEARIVAEGTHEPLVSEATWTLANEVANRHRKSVTGGEPHMLAGLLYCADCGSGMAMGGNHSFVCRRYKMYNRAENGCTGHYIPYDLLFTSVWASVKDVITAARIDRDGLVARLSGVGHRKQAEALDAARKERQRAERRLGEVGALLKKAFEKNVLGTLPDEMYNTLVADYAAERATLTAKVEILAAQVDKLEQETGSAEHFVALVEKYIDVVDLDRDLAHQLIDRIEIGQSYKDPNGIKVYPIDIYFRFVGKIEP